MSGVRLVCGVTAGSAVALATLPGCGAETIALAGAAGNAAESGGQVWSSGKMIGALMVPFEDVNAAVERAVLAFGYEIEIDRLSTRGYRRYLRVKDDAGGRLSVRTDFRAENLTWIQVHSGVFGHQPTARLVLKEIYTELGVEAE